MMTWHWRELGRLVIGLKINEKECSGLSPAQDDAAAYWEVAVSTGIEAADAWVAWFWIAATSQGGYYCTSSNAR